MKIEEYNKGHSFLVANSSFRFLCKCIQKIPGAVFTKRKRFFWSMEDIDAEFTFKGMPFKIETDPWEAGFWVSPTDDQKHIPEMDELREEIEKHAAASKLFFIEARVLR